jgi:hypothetical protein
MSASQPGLQNGDDHSPDLGLSKLSLSSQTIHADDFLNQGQDVAPPLHVSTTFRYNKDPNVLVPWAERDVGLQSRTNHDVS